MFSEITVGLLFCFTSVLSGLATGNRQTLAQSQLDVEGPKPLRYVLSGESGAESEAEEEEGEGEEGQVVDNLELTTQPAHTLPFKFDVSSREYDLEKNYANKVAIMKNRRRLSKFLMNDYERHRVPSKSKPVNVSLHMWPYDILYVNEAKSSIKISGWIDMYWTDEYLVWDPMEFGGIEDVFIPTDAVWQPRIDIFYSKEDPVDMQGCSNCYVRVDHNGLVLRGLYFAYSFPCRINVKYFPFDQQKCELEVANWYMDLRLVDLWPTGNEVDMSVFLPNEEWDLLNISVIRKSTYYIYGEFPSLIYRISMKRKPFYYVCNLIIPSLIITVTAVVGYHMPSTGQGIHLEKVKMGLTAILSIFILQLGISDKMPRTSDVIPLISIFYFCLVSILSLAIPATSLVIVVEKQGLKGRPVPSLLRRIFLCSNDTTINDYLARLSNLDKPMPRTWSSTKKKRPESCDFDSRSSMNEFQKLLRSDDKSPVCKRRSLSSVYYYGDKPPEYGTAMSNNNNTFHLKPNVLDATEKAEPKEKEPSFLGFTPRKYIVASGLQDELRCGVRDVRDFLKERRERDIIRRDWSMLADALERISMFFFLLFISMSVFFFWFHDWY